MSLREQIRDTSDRTAIRLTCVRHVELRATRSQIVTYLSHRYPPTVWKKSGDRLAARRLFSVAAACKTITRSFYKGATKQ